MVPKGRIAKHLQEYSTKELTIATVCSHSSLQIFHGARAEGFKTLGICIGKPPKFYDAFPLAKPDEFFSVKSYDEIVTRAPELLDKGVVVIPTGSFVEYLGAERFADMELPNFGNRAVLDWELSTLGDPMVDFAYHCMTWHMHNGPTSRGLAGHDLAALGIPDEAAYLQAYLRSTGQTGRQISADEWGYYLVFNMFRLAGILQGIMARALQGNASSAEAIETGKRARPLAEEAWRQVERLLVSNY